MKLKLFSIRDAKAGVFLAPFPARSSVEAERQVSASFDNPAMQDTPIFKHPADFQLFVVADFDDETGVILPADPLQIATIESLIPRAQLPS